MEGRLLFEEIRYCKTLVKLAMGYVQTVDDRISINLLSASLKITRHEELHAVKFLSRNLIS